MGRRIAAGIALAGALVASVVIVNTLRFGRAPSSVAPVPLALDMTSAAARQPSTNALVRTTTAATVFHAGVRENVLPTRATAVVNFRILPGDSVASVIAHVERVIDDERIELVSLPFRSEPSSTSSYESHAFRTLARSIHEASPEPDLQVAPYLVIGATDARHYASLADEIYRFVAYTLGSEDLDRIHGVDERISISEYARVIRFYHRLLSNLNQRPPGPL